MWPVREGGCEIRLADGTAGGTVSFVQLLRGAEGEDENRLHCQCVLPRTQADENTLDEAAAGLSAGSRVGAFRPHVGCPSNYGQRDAGRTFWKTFRGGTIDSGMEENTFVPAMYFVSNEMPDNIYDVVMITVSRVDNLAWSDTPESQEVSSISRISCR